MKHRLFAPLALSALAACHVVLLGDLDIGWNIDGSTSPALCSAHGIHKWHILAAGPDRVATDVDCGGTWTSGALFFDIEEGYYNVTVEALDSSNHVLATLTNNGVRVVSGDPPAITDLDFTAADFGGGDTVEVYWNINGTEDGSPRGKSWDTCAEVGATLADVEVNGQAVTHDCHAAGNMTTSVTGFSGKPQVRVRLLDAAGPITTWSPLADAEAASGANTWQYVAEFYWDSFSSLKDTMTGDFLFTVSYEGNSCTQTSPNVAHQVSLLSLKTGTAVTPPPDVCGPDSMCVKADGADFASCYGPDQTQTVVDELWGEYKLKVSGTLPASSSYEICWEKEFDILIGAGTINPTVDLDLTRLSSSGACTP